MDVNEKDWRELIRKVEETHDAVVRMETQWNGGPGRWQTCLTSLAMRQDHEARIRELEKSAWRTAGVAGVLAAVGTTLLTVGVRYVMNVL